MMAAATDQLVAGVPVDVYAVMTSLANRYGAINLAVGSPEGTAPAVLRDAAAQAIAEGANQYAPTPGLPELRTAIASYERRHGLVYDADTEITVTVGCMGALNASLRALLEPGDEVIALAPCYDSFPLMVTDAAARLVRVPLATTGDTYWLDVDRVAAAVTPRTRVLILNSPHNPTGWVATPEDLAALAALAVRHDLRVVADEVYSELSYDARHESIASYDGMRERTVVCGSASKTFTVTGWRVGWALAPHPSTARIRNVHRMSALCAPAPFQTAIAAGLGAIPDEYYDELRATYRSRRAVLESGLRAAGFQPRHAASGYFVVAGRPESATGDDWAYATRLVEEAGVAVLPLPSYVDDPAEARGLYRVSFCRDERVLAEACHRLRSHP